MAAGGIVVEMSSEETKLWRGFQSIIAQQKKMEDGLQKVGGASNKVTAEQRKLERAAKRVYEQTRTPQERYAAKMQQLNALVKQGKISQDTYARATRQATEQMRAAGQAGKNAFGPNMQSMVTGLIGVLGVTGGLAGVLGKVNQGYDVWLENIREIAREANKAADDILVFAALQEGGTKAARVQEVAGIAAKYGITDRGAAFNTVQALQSTYGSYEKGKEVAETVFRAQQVGIDTETGLELEILGKSQGIVGGAALRKAYVAGEASGRSPQDIARAAGGLQFWENKDLGFAAAAVLSGSKLKGELATYLKRGGAGLSQAGSAQEAFEKLGLGEAEPVERLRYLRTEGIDEIAELKKFGFSEIRGQQAVASLVENLPDLERIQKEIGEKAKPGILLGKRAAVEAELVGQKLRRETAQVDVAISNILSLGQKGTEAQRAELLQAQRGLAFTRLGVTQSLWWKVGKKAEEGPGRRATEKDVGHYLMGETAKGLAGYGGGVGAIAATGGALPGGIDLLLRGVAGVHRGAAAQREFSGELAAVKAEVRDPELLEAVRDLKAGIDKVAANTASGNAPPSGNATLVAPTEDK